MCYLAVNDFVARMIVPHCVILILIFLRTTSVGNDSGVHINNIIASVQGYSEGEVRSAINVLSNEGLIYSTIDEDNFQYAE